MAELVDFARYVRPEVPTCPEIMILDAILHAGIEFCERTNIYQESVSVTTVIGQSTYNLLLLMSVGYQPEDILTVKRAGASDLKPSSQQDNFDSYISDMSGIPNYYYLDGLNLILSPKPDVVETLQVILKARPYESATTLPEILLQRHRRTIAAGALGMLMKMAGKAWSNLDMAVFNNAIFNKAIDDEAIKYAKGGGNKPLRAVASFF